MLVMRSMSYAEPSHARRSISWFTCVFLISCMGRIGRMGLFWTAKEIQSQQHVSSPSSLDQLGACR